MGGVTHATTLSGRDGLIRPRSLLRAHRDDRLVAQLRAGNEHAFEALFDRYRPRLLAFCRGMLRSSEDAEDVLQEVFTAAHSAILADEREIEVRPWLYRIARNRCLNHMRRPQPECRETLDDREGHNGTTTEEHAERRADLRDLVSNIRELPEAQRSALLMRELEALSYSQIAASLDTTVPAVKSLLVRARVTLAEASQANDLTCEEVRFELAAAAEGMGKTTGPARHHVRRCPECTRYRKHLRSTSRGLAALSPVGPLLLLKKFLAAKLASGGGTGGGGGAGLAGGASATGGIGAGAGGTAAASAVAAGAGVAGGAGLAGSKVAASAAVAAVLSAGSAFTVATTPALPTPDALVAAATPATAADAVARPAPDAARSPSREPATADAAAEPAPAETTDTTAPGPGLTAPDASGLTPEQLARLRELFANDRAAARAWWRRFQTHNFSGGDGPSHPPWRPPPPDTGPSPDPPGPPVPPQEPEPEPDPQPDPEPRAGTRAGRSRNRSRNPSPSPSPKPRRLLRRSAGPPEAHVAPPAKPRGAMRESDSGGFA